LIMPVNDQDAAANTNGRQPDRQDAQKDQQGQQDHTQEVKQNGVKPEVKPDGDKQNAENATRQPRDEAHTNPHWRRRGRSPGHRRDRMVAPLAHLRGH
jgi:hypothetical protein